MYDLMGALLGWNMSDKNSYYYNTEAFSRLSRYFTHRRISKRLA